jgi:hypothetical protein
MQLDGKQTKYESRMNHTKKHDMAISKHSSGDIARNMCGICLLDHK